ncbi:hypothetical protein HPB47_002531, partial [Ixodes persulcatus]
VAFSAGSRRCGPLGFDGGTVTYPLRATSSARRHTAWAALAEEKEDEVRSARHGDGPPGTRAERPWGLGPPTREPPGRSVPCSDEVALAVSHTGERADPPGCDPVAPGAESRGCCREQRLLLLMLTTACVVNLAVTGVGVAYLRLHFGREQAPQS